MVVMDEVLSVKNFFAAHHIQLSTDWIECCINWCKTENLPPNYTIKDMQLKMYEQWLLLDLRDVEMPCLPPNLSTKVLHTLNGNYALQMMKVVDISKPKHWQLQKIRNNLSKNTEDEVQSSKRVLQMTLTDGVQEIEAMEFKPIPALNLNLSPGIKIMLYGPITIRRGRIMLQKHHVKVLGGEVEELLVPNAAENVLAKVLKLPLNPNPKVIEESLLTANKDMFSETGVTSTPAQQNRNSITVVNVSSSRPVQQNHNAPRNAGIARTTDHISDQERIESEIDEMIEIERELEQARPKIQTSGSRCTKTPDMFDDMDDSDFANIDVPEAVIRINKQPQKLPATTMINKEPSKLPSTTNNNIRSSINTTPEIIDVSDSLDLEHENEIFANIDIDAHLDKIDKDLEINRTPKRHVLTIEQLLKNIPDINNGKFKIRAKFKSVVKRLTVSDDGFYLVVQVGDDTGVITVRFHNDLITDMAGCSSDVMLGFKNSVEENQAEIRQNVLEIVGRLKQKLERLNNVMEVQVNASEEFPVVVAVLEDV
ncbi:hypothetical protein NQ317_015915 [Molorchus minor]|uniref:RecQ-mediated genome instability protein 1 n=1 Tax=Molorchus minor TaxID=1323400 RepID=A0ABQ9JJ63_9CUCU|nr:hypothetical protein NQ317_015915 [Molorchus minor]